MNKKMLTLGVCALVAGFFVFSAYKTREEQMAEIEQMVTMKLDELRAEKEQECTDKINTEAQRRFDEILVQREAEAAAKPGKKSGGKKGGSKGSKVDPLPQPTPPPTTRDRGDVTDPAKKKERGDVTDPAKKRERGDVQQKAGGGN